MEVKLLAENRHKGWKIDYFPQVEGLLIKKRGNISIRCLVYSQRLHCWLVVKSFIVFQPKSGGVVRLGAAPERQKIAPCIDQIANQN